MMDLEGKLKLEYYKLKKTFEGAIPLKEEPGVYQPAGTTGTGKPEEKQPLDEILEKINEQYKGEFTEADKVLLTTLRAKLMGDVRLQTMARTSDPLIFLESIFPKAFGTVAHDSYRESRDTYEALFKDTARYNAVMRALGRVLYRELRENP